MTTRIRRFRGPLLAALAALCALALIVSGIVLTSAPTARLSQPEPTVRDRSPERSAPDDFRPAAHITPAAHWMNDPQRPVFAGGRWHLYYLFNADHPDGNGTAWYHVSSTDLVTWRDEGVAIEKYTDDLGDIWSGSVVVDEHDTAGFGAGALVALATQQHDGVQRQSLFVSTDGGTSFAPFAGNPVMDNPGVDAWRDPKVVWDDARERWIMLLAEGEKIGFYTSPDLKSWTYRSGFVRDDLGILECPDLFEIAVDGDPSRTTWVLGASANGSAAGRTTGYAYWTGDFDGESFRPDTEEPTWLDDGPDFYAGVTWADPQAEDPLAHRYALGWMNNWAYAGDLPTRGWAGGALSSVRELTMQDHDGRLALASRPAALEGISGESVVASGLAAADGEEFAGVPQPGSEAYRLRITATSASESGTLRVQLGGDRGAVLEAELATGAVSLERGGDLAAPGAGDEYAEIRTTRDAPDAGRIELDVVVDALSIEAFAQGGRTSLTALSFRAPGGLDVTAHGGDVMIDEISVTTLAAD
ncbi:glycoside hydrolase family 32 protein [Microbacterium karelineae]|uniref:glycoside hydrolase family 32 protein n=1 Tax=Microbacterium karelineae TaxID=2654283 RepID=UPI0012EADD71|nr:glycoside hydrolase family 32 protein [Microbacterium karelineae]